MNMSEVITRINVLAKKAKTEGLTTEEVAERDKLRRIYIDSVKANLVGQRDNTYSVGPGGTKKKLESKKGGNHGMSSHQQAGNAGAGLGNLRFCLRHRRCLR